MKRRDFLKSTAAALGAALTLSHRALAQSPELPNEPVDSPPPQTSLRPPIQFLEQDRNDQVAGFSDARSCTFRQ